MHRKLLTMLVSACALAAVLVGPASASASTLTLYDDVIGEPVTRAYFDSDATTVTNSLGVFQCDEFSFWASVTQNQANPVTLSLLTSLSAQPSYAPTLGGCLRNGVSGLTYSNLQATGSIQFNANGTGTLPVQVTQNWAGSGTCVRQGTLSLTYTPNESVNQRVHFDGYVNKTSGSAVCPATERWQGTFGGQGSSDAPTDEFGVAIDWVVTP